MDTSKKAYLKKASEVIFQILAHEGLQENYEKDKKPLGIVIGNMQNGTRKSGSTFSFRMGILKSESKYGLYNL